MSALIHQVAEPGQDYLSMPGTVPVSSSVVGPNPCVLLRKQEDLIVCDSSMPTTIPSGHVLLEIKAVGVCMSDIHYLRHGGIGKYIVKAPMILGHETAGRIAQVADNVFDLKVGDKVAIEGGISCSQCKLCKSGRYNLCPDMKFFATPPVDGAFRRYVLHPANLCFKLPENLSYEHGALCEPMSVAVMAANRAKLHPGQRVAVMGAGPIGLMMASVALAYGADHVIVTDINPVRLKRAQQLGAQAVFDMTGHTAQSAIEAITQQFGQVDITFDCAGTSVTTNTSVGVCCNGATVVSIGLAETRQTIDTSEIGMREVDLIGLFRYCHTYPTCISLLASGKVNVDSLITHPIEAATGEGDQYRFNDAAIMDGIDIARTGRDGAIKVMFKL